MFSLMTWNLENFERPAANAEQAVKERYAGKLQQITELITSTGPDLDGGQEVLADPKNLSPPAFDDLRQALGGEWTGCLSRRPDPRGIRMGWLARGQLTNPTEVAVYPHQVPTTTVDDDDHRLQARGPAAPCSWRPSPKAPASSRWSRAGAGRRGPSSASRRPTGRCCRPCPGGGRRASTRHRRQPTAPACSGCSSSAGSCSGRRRPGGQGQRYLGVLPDGFAATVATSLYGLAAAALAVLSLDSFLVAGGDGTSQWLSAAIVAAAMAVVYGVSLYRTVLPRARTGVATLPLDQAR